MRLVPIDTRLAPHRFVVSQQLGPGFAFELLPHLLLLGPVLLIQGLAGVGVAQAAHHRNRARGVDDMDGLVPVSRRDLYRRVFLACGGPTDEERQVQVPPLHLPGHVGHLFQRWGDEPAQADDVCLLLDGGFDNLVRRHHDAEVDHLVVVAL